MRNKNSKCNIRPWEDSPNNTFDKQPGWSSDSAHPIKTRRVEKARDRARRFLEEHGCHTARIRSDRQLNYLLSLCFGVSIDWQVKPKAELIRASRVIAEMGARARKLKARSAQKSGHPVIKQFWGPNRTPIDKIRDRARAFLGSHGCRTSQIRDDRELHHLLSLCFGVLIDRDAEPKSELIRAVRAIADMGPKARKLRVRAAHKRGHPAIREYWNASRIVE
jgi:hypothetical protein